MWLTVVMIVLVLMMMMMMMILVKECNVFQLRHLPQSCHLLVHNPISLSLPFVALSTRHYLRHKKLSSHLSLTLSTPLALPHRCPHHTHTSSQTSTRVAPTLTPLYTTERRRKSTLSIFLVRLKASQELKGGEEKRVLFWPRKDHLKGPIKNSC